MTSRFTLFTLTLTLMLTAASCGGPSKPRVHHPTDDLFPAATPDGADPNSAEISIRNQTEVEMPFTILPGGGSASSAITLKPGEVHTFAADKGVRIRCMHNGEEVTRSLDRGKHYAFYHGPDGVTGLYRGSHGRTDVTDLAPYVPTPMSVVHKMLEFGGVSESDVVFDIGCGDGRIVITAATSYGARGVGIDLDPQRIAESNANAKAAKVTDKVEFLHQDATKADISSATVVTLYLLPFANGLMRPVLEAQLKPGTPVVAHGYRVPGWESKLQETTTVLGDEDDETHTLYLYRR